VAVFAAAYWSIGLHFVMLQWITALFVEAITFASGFLDFRLFVYYLQGPLETTEKGGDIVVQINQ
jgi:hypothetical protein